MYKYQFHFGDYCNDGHGQYATIHLRSPKTVIELNLIHQKILRDYPEFDDWKGGLCRQYGQSCLGQNAWDTLKAMNFPWRNIIQYCDFDPYVPPVKCDEIDFNSIEPEDCLLGVDAIAQIFIWLMNRYGAELTIVEDKDLHMSFHYGYGCF